MERGAYSITRQRYLEYVFGACIYIYTYTYGSVCVYYCCSCLYLEYWFEHTGPSHLERLLGTNLQYIHISNHLVSLSPSLSIYIHICTWWRVFCMCQDVALPIHMQNMILSGSCTSHIHVHHYQVHICSKAGSFIRLDRMCWECNTEVGSPIFLACSCCCLFWACSCMMM